MNTQKLFYLAFAFIGILSCKTTTNTFTDNQIISLNNAQDNNHLELIAIKGEGHNNPTFAIWLEDMEGNYLKTLFITKSFASGIYAYGALNDSTWSNEPGASYRPAALPYWSFKKGLIDDNYIIPEKDHPFVDAYSGATPKGSFTLKTDNPNRNKYRIMMEVNQTWDWNKYWTNSKYPGNRNYMSSAQPSVIYAVTIDLSAPMESYILNPIGHGHYAGNNGALYTDLSTFTSALKIFERLEVKIKYN